MDRATYLRHLLLRDRTRGQRRPLSVELVLVTADPAEGEASALEPIGAALRNVLQDTDSLFHIGQLGWLVRGDNRIVEDETRTVVATGMEKPLDQTVGVGSFRLDQPLMDRLIGRSPHERAKILMDAFLQAVLASEAASPAQSGPEEGTMHGTTACHALDPGESASHDHTPRVELPPAILAEAIRILADLFLMHLGVAVAAEGRHESERSRLSTAGAAPSGMRGSPP